MYFSKSHSYSDGKCEPRYFDSRIRTLALPTYREPLRSFPNTEIGLTANSFFEEWSKKYW